MTDIGKMLTEAVQENLRMIIIVLVACLILYAINIVLGTINGTKKDGFDVKKFFFGVMKMVVIGLCVLAYCYVLNLLQLIPEEIFGIEIPVEVISVTEVYGIVKTWAYDMAKEVREKIKEFMELKYYSYDDIKLTSQENKEGGQG